MKRKSGFSLIEVLMATFLVMLCAMIVAVTMPTANNSRAKADNLNKAVGLSQKHLEAVRGLGYPGATVTQLLAAGLIDDATPVAPNTYSFTNVDNASLDNPSRILPNGQGRILVEQADIDLRRVTITLTWTEKSQTKTFRLGTLIANL